MSDSLVDSLGRGLVLELASGSIGTNSLQKAAKCEKCESV